ncbi:MAG: hypothetical protein U9P71_01860 [Campylobacterota bacterium]|nr:hypothetical protein [Campylobacterota bacterium]
MISLNLLLAIAVLSLLLIALVVFYIKSAQKKKESISSKKSEADTVVPTFKELKAIMKNQEASTAELHNAVNDLLKYYGTIPPKQGIHPNKKFQEYASLLVTVCHHKHVNAKIVVHFENQLKQMNPNYENNIEEMLKRGLNSRT